MLDMDNTTNGTQADPAALVESLDAESLRRQIAERERQLNALRVLFRAARARERSKTRQGGPTHAA